MIVTSGIYVRRQVRRCILQILVTSNSFTRDNGSEVVLDSNWSRVKNEKHVVLFVQTDTIDNIQPHLLRRWTLSNNPVIKSPTFGSGSLS